jgi:hypothetical protein
VNYFTLLSYTCRMRIQVEVSISLGTGIHAETYFMQEIILLEAAKPYGTAPWEDKWKVKKRRAVGIWDEFPPKMVLKEVFSELVAHGRDPNECDVIRVWKQWERVFEWRRVSSGVDASTP